MTHYQVLGVPPDADASTIHKAYRRLASQYHPDRVGDDPAAREKFHALNVAHEVLKDPVSRRRYDRGVAAPERACDLLRRDRGRRMVETTFASPPKAPHPGANTVSVVEVSEEILRVGGVVRIPMPAGDVDLRVPPGAAGYGTARDHGAPGRNGGASGDHLVVLVPLRVS
jgi:DnaJ-class molecular chaperone